MISINLTTTAIKTIIENLPPTPEVIKEMEGDEWDIVPSRDSNLDGCYAVMWRPEPEDGVRYTPNDGMFCQWQTIVHMWLLGKLKSLSC
jgi:hypothetical protein